MSLTPAAPIGGLKIKRLARMIRHYGVVCITTALDHGQSNPRPNCDPGAARRKTLEAGGQCCDDGITHLARRNRSAAFRAHQIGGAHAVCQDVYKRQG